MKRGVKIALVIIAVGSFAAALSYPLLYRREEQSNNKELEELAQMRADVLEQLEENAEGSASGDADSSDKGEFQTEALEDLSAQTAEISADEHRGDDLDGESPPEKMTGDVTLLSDTLGDSYSGEEGGPPALEELILDYVPGMTWKQVNIPEYEGAAAPVLLSNHKAAENRDERTNALPYDMKEKVLFEPSKILPELKAIYALNNDLVGWIKIEDTVIDYPVVQTKDSDFYLEHDFYKKENINGQIILDSKCDPYTPSYNLIISGHHMRNGSMFGNLPLYKSKEYWEEHKVFRFDNLLSHGTYVIFAAFASADYDEDEAGFRYNKDIRFRIDAEQWLAEVHKNKLYDTKIDAEFGDEFITLTTCDRSARSDGRFVVVGRKLHEGEVFK